MMRNVLCKALSRERIAHCIYLDETLQRLSVACKEIRDLDLVSGNQFVFSLA